MAERKTITTLSVITDSETPYDNIGDIDGGWIDPEWLQRHISTHGPEGLLRTLCYVQHQVFEAMRAVNMKKDYADTGANKIQKE